MPTKRLTARLVENLSTDKGREDFSDTAVIGLQLRVTDRGTKTWAVRYTRKADGRRRRLTIGAYPGMSLAEARNEARRQLATVFDGADPAMQVQERRVAPTFEDVAAEWLTRHAETNKVARAVADDRSMLGRHVLPVIGAMKAQDVKKRDIALLLDSVSAKPDARFKQSGSSRAMSHRPNRVFELVRAIFRWAHSRDLVDVDPTVGLQPPIKKEKPRDRELSPDEIATLWDGLERAPSTRPMRKSAGDFPMTRTTAISLALALVTAQRIGEIVGISHDELDLNDISPVWTLPAARSKNGEANRIPLSRIAVELIREAQNINPDSEWLFPSPRGAGPMGTHAPTRALERAREVLGIAHFRVHDLRRTAATRMAEIGINPHTISVVLNHISARRGTVTGRVYNQYSYDKEKREALDKWGERLATLILSSAPNRNQDDLWRVVAFIK